MKIYLYLSLLFAFAILNSLFAQKTPVTVKAAQENFKLQYKLKQLSKDIQKTEKQLKANQRENISAIESIKAKTENLKEQNNTLQKETKEISSELEKVLNRKIFELKTRQEIIDYQGKKLDWILMGLAVVVAGLTVIISIAFFAFSNKLWKQSMKADALQKELDDLIKSKKDEFDNLIKDKENEFKKFTKNIKIELKKIIEEQKTCTDLANRAYQALIAKNYSEAINLYTELIKIAPEDYIAYNNRGVAYRNLEEFSKAIEDYTKAIELKPDYADAYYGRGTTYGKQGEFSSAIKDYTKIIDLEPDYINAYMNLIEVLIIIGDFCESDKYFNQVKTHKQSTKDMSAINMLKTISTLADGKDAEIELEKFKETLKGEVSLTWGFDELEGWLESPEFKASAGIKNKSKIQDVIKDYKARKAELKGK